MKFRGLPFPITAGDIHFENTHKQVLHKSSEAKDLHAKVASLWLVDALEGGYILNVIK